MSLAYAPRGLIGVLTPQANTTVEPEFWIMLPPGVAAINARMMSSKEALEARLVDYLENLDATIAQFANAPLGAIAIATTGTSYIAGAAREQELVDRITTQTGVPLAPACRRSKRSCDRPMMKARCCCPACCASVGHRSAP